MAVTSHSGISTLTRYCRDSLNSVLTAELLTFLPLSEILLNDFYPFTTTLELAA